MLAIPFNYGVAMKKMILSLALVCGFLGLFVQAQADEVRVGVMVHDAKVFEDLIFGGVHGKEQSISISGDYVWDSPDWLSWAMHARPYVGGTVNLEGNTSHGGAGLLWRFDLGKTKKLYLETGFGLVAHTGTVRVPNPIDATTPEDVAARFVRKRSEIEFGSSILFRSEFALGRRFNEKWAGEIVFEHLSHGQILGGPENEGSNNLGVRFARRF